MIALAPAVNRVDGRKDLPAILYVDSDRALLLTGSRSVTCGLTN
jgi:hypothetical protein